MTERYRIEIVTLETGSTELFCTPASAQEADLCLKQAWRRCLEAIEAGYPLWLSPLKEGHFELRKAPRPRTRGNPHLTPDGMNLGSNR